MLVRDDTIAAIASPPGGGLRGIVRISGPAAESIWRAFCTPLAPPAEASPCVIPVLVHLAPPWPPISARLCWWPGPRSYTRQPVAEWHLPGSPPLLDAVLAAVCQAGARLAEPGEFTLRAFLSGRIDLTQAEAVLGVIDARSRRELDVALEQLAGGLAGPLRELRVRLIHTLAELEAGLDFVEEDIEFVSARQLYENLDAGREEVEQLRTRLQSRSAGGGLPRVVLLGLPNAGKSSLWNSLAGGLPGTSAALVADQPGTTRDYLEREIDFNGHRCLLVDTAGLDAVGTDDPIGFAAQQATRRQGDRAELRLICRSADCGLDTSNSPSGFGLAMKTDGDASADMALEQSSAELVDDPLSTRVDDTSRLVVRTKSDLLDAIPPNGDSVVWVSSRTGTGLAELRRKIAERIERINDDESAVVAGTAARCGDSLRRAAESLARAVALARIAVDPSPTSRFDSEGENNSDRDGGDFTVITEFGDSATSLDLMGVGSGYGQGLHGRDEFIAAELRLALDALGQVAGAVHSEDILDVVFSRFCIGK
jgi:tRNA modification GTPase